MDKNWFVDIPQSVHRLHVAEWALRSNRPELAYGFSSMDELVQFRISFVDEIGIEAWNDAEKQNHALQQKRKRVQHRLQRMLAYPSWFLTLTFSDDVLASTSAATRRRYVSRFLSAASDFYLANVDYGKTSGREHYHAVVCIPGADPGFKFEKWPYGFDKVQRIPSEKSDAALARYLVKLGFHATKGTAGRLLYSKALPEPYFTFDSHFSAPPIDFPDEWL